MGDRDKGTRDEGMWGMGQGRRGWGTREQGQGDMDGGRGDTERGRGDGDSVGDKGTGTRDKETGKDQVTGGGQDRRGTGGDKGTGEGTGGTRDSREREEGGEMGRDIVTSCPTATWLCGDVADGTQGTSPMAPAPSTALLGDCPRCGLALGTSGTLPRGCVCVWGVTPTMPGRGDDVLCPH